MSLTEDMADQSAADRSCAFRGCSAPLPPPTGRPGNRPKYCQDGRTWGSNALSCKSAEAAYLAVASLQGDGPVTAAGMAELAGRLDAAAEPLRVLLDAVTATRTHLEHDVVTARNQRDAAMVAAAADRGAREIADADAARAHQAAAAAERQSGEAIALSVTVTKAREAAETRTRDAERELLRGEGRLAALQDRLLRAEELTDEASAHAARLDNELADALATLRARDDELHRELARTEELRRTHRAELAARDTDIERTTAAQARLWDDIRTEHLADLDRLTAAHSAELCRLAAADVTALSDTRREHEVVRTQLAERLATVHHELGAVEHERDRLVAELTSVRA